MEKNEDRIWDVLLEDAMRDLPSPDENFVPGDRTRRLLTPVGPLGVDRGRSMRRTRRPRWIPIVGTVVVVAIIAALFAGASIWLPQLAGDNHTGQNPEQQATDNTQEPASNQSNNNQSPVREGRDDQPASNRDNPPANSGDETPTPDPQPEPKDNNNPEPDNSPEPEPTPESNPDTTPGVQPEPEKPDDVVKEPKPAPEPEPKQPEDTVEEPEPKQPEETSPVPKSRPAVTLLQVAKRNRLEVAYGTFEDGSPAYRTLNENEHLGMVEWILAKDPVDLEVGGVFLRLEGELHIDSMEENGLKLALSDDSLFVDSRGAGRKVAISVSNRLVTMQAGAMFIRIRMSTKVSVFEGEVWAGDKSVPGGNQARLRKNGPTVLEDFKSTIDEHAFLSGLGNRIVYREDFNSDVPNGRLREGTIEEGVLNGAKVFWGYPEDLRHEDGLVVRLRVRFSGAGSVTLTQFAVPREDNFSFEVDAEHGLKVGEWYTLEVPLSKFLERSNHRDSPNKSDSFQNISLAAKGEGAQVELDWVELIRAVKKQKKQQED